MAKVRSPNYPQLDLGAALTAVRKAFDKDHRNKMSPTALAKHLGHEGLSGPANTKIGALRGFGLVDGSGDELRVSDDAVTVLMAPSSSSERAEALKRLALKPSLFQEIQKAFATLPSTENLEYWLVKRNYTPAAAKIAAKSYLASMRLAAGESTEYDPADDGEADQTEAAPMTPNVQAPGKPGAAPTVPPAKPGTLQEVFNLDEGPVTLTFPASLSLESYDDLSDHLALFLRKAKRRAEVEKRARDFERRINKELDDEQ